MITSPGFWLLLAIGVPVFWLIPQRLRLGALALASFAYLYTLEPFSVLALLGFSLGFYYVAPVARSNPKWRVTGILALGVLAFLAYFKYLPPLVAALTGGSAAAALAVPLGISYFTFKLIHYAIEVGRGNIKDRSLQQFFCYLYLFPIYTAGPIERFDHFLANQESRWQLQSFVEGSTRIVHGLIKKLVIGEVLLRSALGELNTAYVVANLGELSPLQVWWFLIVTFLLMYVDFSGYSDIAIGSSRLFGLRIMENFNWPILAPNIAEFWKRWHMTLAGWCRAYIYMTMIGLTRNPYLAIYATFVTMGIWHAGSPHWIMWGIWHATGMSIYVIFGRLKRRHGWSFFDSRVGYAAGIVMTFLFVCAGGAFTATHHVVGFYDAVRVVGKLIAVPLPALGV